MNTPRSHAFGFTNLYRDFLFFGIFILICATGLSGLSDISHDKSRAVNDSSSLLTQILWLFIFANSVLLALLGRLKWHQFFRTVVWLLPLMIWIISSSLWSAYPEITIRRAAREDIELMSIMLVTCMYLRPSELSRLILISFFITSLFDLASLFSATSYTADGFRGIHSHKNSLGEFYFLALPLFMLSIFDRVTLWVRLAAALASTAGIVFLLLSHSKTAIGLFVIVSLCVAAVYVPRYFKRYVIAIAVVYLLIIMIAVSLLLTNGFEETVGFLTGDPTLTGRLSIWRYLLVRWQESPYIGLGYGAVWQVGSQTVDYLRLAEVSWIMNEGHNGYLDALAQIGIIGFMFLCFFLLAAIWVVAFTKQRSPNATNIWQYYCIYVVLGVPLYNMAETTLARPGSLGWILFVVVFAAACLSKERLIVKIVYPNNRKAFGRLSHQRT